MPKGNSAVSVPMLLSSRWNRSASMLFTEPSDRNTIPNRSIPRQAAAKTRLRLYMRAELIAGQRSNGQGKQRAVANPRLETRNPKEIRKPKAEGTNPLPNPKPRTSCLPTSDPESAASQPGRRVSSDFGFRALGFSNSALAKLRRFVCHLQGHATRTVKAGVAAEFRGLEFHLLDADGLRPFLRLG